MPRYGQRSEPQMHEAGSPMIASVGSTIFGSSRSSKRTSPGPYITVPCIMGSLQLLPGCTNPEGDRRGGEYRVGRGLAGPVGCIVRGLTLSPARELRRQHLTIVSFASARWRSVVNRFGG